jgi:hypothetical protein
MISKTTTTALIIAMLSLVGLTALAGVSQTVFAQSVGDRGIHIAGGGGADGVGGGGGELNIGGCDGPGNGDTGSGGGGTGDGVGGGSEGN